ncbi:putative sugar transporter [Xylariales sp. PMI_506]|nr:putative sugar transporter [Xylariales sp. PMI_506]
MGDPYAQVSGYREPNNSYGYKVYFLAFSVAWASAMFGYDAAFIGSTITLPSFERRYGLDRVSSAELSALSSNIVSTFQAGAFFGAIFGFLLGERFGRKPIIIVTGLVFVLGVILQLLGLNLGLLYAGRALTGISIGGSTTLLPIYIAECSPAAIRGRLVGFTEVMIQLGLIAGFWVNYGVALNVPDTDKQWRIPVGVQLVPAGMLLISVPFLPESPRWLVSKDRIDPARKSLQWIRGLPADHHYISEEIDRIQSHITFEIESTGGKRSTSQMLRELTAPGVRNRVCISVLLMLLQNLSGVNGINYYSPTILKAIGFTGTSVGLLATGIYGIAKGVSAIIFILFIVDRFGRRPALLLGAIGAMIPMYYIAAYSKLSGSFSGAVEHNAASNATLAMIYIFAISFGFSWNNIPWIFASEVLPNRVRTLGMMCAVCMQWLSQFLVVYSLPYMIRNITYGTFIFFGSCIFVSFVFAFFFVPETKGVALEDMDLLLGADAPTFAVSARKRYEEVHQAGLTALALSHAQKTEDVAHIERPVSSE